MDTLLAVVILATQFSEAAYVGRLSLTVLGIAGQMLLAFLFFYTLTVFCGMLCGTSSMLVMLTGLVLGAFPAGLAMVLALISEQTLNIDIGYYFSCNWSWTSPVLRVCYLLRDPLAWWEVPLILLLTAGLFALTLVIYRRRRVERAGTPVVFYPIERIVKWVVMVLATLALGLLFMALGDGSLFWRFFGFVLGGFLSFLLINTILTKNPKQMFDGWRRMLIYLVVFCVGYVGFMLGVTAIDGMVPKNVGAVRISIAGENYNVKKYTDPAVRAEWERLWAEYPEKTTYDVMRETYDNESVYVYTDEYGAETAEYGEDRLDGYRFENPNVYIRPIVWVGAFPVAFQPRAYSYAEAEALLRAMTESEEFEAGYRSMLVQLDTTTENDYMAISHGIFLSAVRNLGITSIYAEDGSHEMEKIVLSVIEDFEGDIGFETFQYPVWAEACFYGVERTAVDDSRRLLSLSLRMNMSATLQAVTWKTADELYERMADFILDEYGYLLIARHEAYVFSENDDFVIRVEDRAQIMEILQGLSGYGTRSVLTVPDEGYGVAFPTGENDDVFYFIKGKVPAFVTAALG